MKKIFDRKNIIITGGSGGIGSVVAANFLEEGGKVLILGRDKNDLEKRKKELVKISKSIYVKSLDVSNRKEFRRLNQFINKYFSGRIDVLINAAGIYGPMGKLEDSDLDFWEKTIKINLMGTVNMCAYVIPFMKKKKNGRIINFSGGGDGPFPRFTAYSSSKGAVLRFTESLAAELGGYNIFVNAIAPGPVNTGLLEEVLRSGERVVGKDFYRISKEQKLSGGTSPNMAAKLILFLASDKSKNMTGKMISAVWDNWQDVPRHLKTIMNSDIYNIRRIKPKDRGYGWK